MASLIAKHLESILSKSPWSSSSAKSQKTQHNDQQQHEISHPAVQPSPLPHIRFGEVGAIDKPGSGDASNMSSEALWTRTSGSTRIGMQERSRSQERIVGVGSAGLTPGSEWHPFAAVSTPQSDSPKADREGENKSNLTPSQNDGGLVRREALQPSFSSALSGEEKKNHQHPELIELCLSDNALSSFPDVVFLFPALISLCLKGCACSQLPEHLTCLQQLELGDFSKCGLLVLPPFIGQFVYLEELIVRKNNLSTLPRELAQCKNLKCLDAGYNQITSFPEFVCELSALLVLRLSNNRISTLPTNIGQLKELKELQMENNLLTTLPIELGKCVHLEILCVECNPLLAPPSGILVKGAAVLLAYLRAQLVLRSRRKMSKRNAITSLKEALMD
ncbi:hypothetical protein CBR_g12047 [Chara braunii]|uniref:Uncharacterized protein n=1 Tax=Chara braunii TaxID=69332 RepID=A0A388KR17_CHABU|nr:hypothetical protein CBR_g12047 [Chara braunii]|eukprot:GBG72472.1 hypothetical protein CBR_g12047 [Chara braunii]